MTTYNKVTLDGTTLMDISDTTAVAADVASGKYFYTASGVKTAGTASGGSSNFKETVDVVYDNQAGNTYMAIPLTDTTKDNYVVSWAVVETGTYSNGVLTKDSTPTIPSGQNMPFTGVSTFLSTYQKFTGKTISTNRNNYGVISTNAVVRTSLSSYALSEGLTKTSTGLSMKGQYAFGKANYYLKYRCIVYGWNN